MYKVIFIVLVFAVSACAQDLMAESVDLASSPPCGIEEKPNQIIVSGKVAKRDFDEDAMTLIGAVIISARDQRSYVNFDSAFLQDQTANLTSQLSELMTVGRYVKVKVDVCGRTMTVRRLISSKSKK